MAQPKRKQPERKRAPRREREAEREHELVLGMPAARFLAQVWQKKPLLIRGGVPNFCDPLTPEELAGLACEDGVESRLVREKGGAHPWEVTWGPHPEERFRKLPKKGWTLLVQEVNRWVPEIAMLLDRVAFLPSVRIDDVMVSFAAPGGSVGPHVDSYDVFLVQGKGRRRWRYDTKPTKDVRFVPNLDLRILERFTPEADEVLEAGDVLYIPPGFAHHGIAESDCLTYSIGFRSPSEGELRAAFAADRARLASALLADPPLVPQDNAGAIPRTLLARIRDIVRAERASDEEIDRWFASFSTRLAPGHAIEPPARPLKDVLGRLARDQRVRRTEEGRFAFLPRPKGACFLYVGGEEIAIDRTASKLAQLIASKRSFRGTELLACAKSASARALVSDLFARGALLFDH